MPRTYNYDIMPEIKARYAVKYFEEAPIALEELLPVMEAARYAPSCFNEQPWRFLVAHEPERHDKLAACLTPGNAWAKKAPVLILVMATKSFVYNDKPNAHNRYDTGCATGFLQLEAVRRGFAVHCMSGFDAEQARLAFDLPESLDIIAVVALGRAKADLTGAEREDQAPGTRADLAKFLL